MECPPPTSSNDTPIPPMLKPAHCPDDIDAASEAIAELPDDVVGQISDVALAPPPLTIGGGQGVAANPWGAKAFRATPDEARMRSLRFIG